MSKYTLHFFSVGISESVRNAFNMGEVEYTEDRMAEGKFRERYPEAILGMVLSIEGENDIIIPFSILRYIGSLGGLYPSDPFDAMKVDECLELTRTFRGKLNARTCTLEETLEFFEYIAKIHGR